MFGKKEVKTDDDQKQNLEQSAQLEEKISQNIAVHKMPKNYKAGTFSYDDYFSSGAEATGTKGGTPKIKAKGKKTGIIIMVVGLLVIGAVAFGAYLYLKSPEKFNLDSLTSWLRPKTAPMVSTSTKPVVKTPVVIPTSTFTMVTTTEEVATTTLKTTTTPEIIIPTSTAITDTDADGLNDAEEAILGTNANLADTDGDKYNDLTELIGGYNPSGNGKLVNDVNIKKYVSAAYKYSILYPQSWKLDLVDKGASVIFTAADQSFIQVVTQANDKKLSIKKWYETEFATIVLDPQVVKYNNWEGVKSNDGLIVYLTDKDLKNIYIISYTPVSDQTLSYLNIFEAMMRSFTVEK